MSGHLDAALSAVDRGWPVFPLRPGLKRPRAQMTGWEQRATTDRHRIGRWWRRHPTDNIAIATGPAGLVVIDLDLARPDEPRPPELPAACGGSDVLEALAARHGQRIDDTWTVSTASGGRHLYYRAPETGGPWRNTAGVLGWHLDTRAGQRPAPGRCGAVSRRVVRVVPLVWARQLARQRGRRLLVTVLAVAGVALVKGVAGTVVAALVGGVTVSAGVLWVWVRFVEPWLFAPRSTRPSSQLAHPVAHSRPSASDAERHVAFARALAYVATRYLAECERERGDEHEVRR